MELPVKPHKNGKTEAITAFVYIMHEERPLGIPSSYYVRTCVQGYRDFGFKLKYLRLAFDISEGGVRNEKF